MTRRIGTLLAAAWLVIFLFTFFAPADQVLAATHAKVNATSLNIREKPATSSKAIGNLKKGQVVTIIQQQGGWTKVPFGKKSGWVSSKYITLITLQTAAKSGYVTGSNLNLRQSASTSAKSLALLSRGTLVTIQSTVSSWYKVYVPSKKKTGWVSNKYIANKKATAETAAPAKPALTTTVTYYVTASSLYIRKEPSTSSSSITSVKKSGAVSLFEKKGTWGKVKTASGKTGWASLSYLTSKVPAKPVETELPNGVKDKVIVIDPGHGGSDAGAVGKYKTTEKAINLATANELKTLLGSAGARVVMTRVSNEGRKLDLDDRIEISHKYKADVFISIHYNSGGNATGVETYYDTKYGNETELAKCIQTEVVKQTGMRDRGVKTAGFYVVKYNKMPSVLVELGFISNPNEEKVIATTAYQQKAARGIFNGLNKYFN
ncbi:N-acetylmuramoyl-L-alanine amidase [Peribacillus cavernae]|nr:N-acetylmuramoyl-L-alanine amidase [Peribacillus cavernae]MDQ0220006.1 N-acetylmuramoyl-L-alanine amidase [Peribacillus cavernae]